MWYIMSHCDQKLFYHYTAVLSGDKNELQENGEIYIVQGNCNSVIAAYFSASIEVMRSSNYQDVKQKRYR